LHVYCIFFIWKTTKTLIFGFKQLFFCFVLIKVRQARPGSLRFLGNSKNLRNFAYVLLRGENYLFFVFTLLGGHLIKIKRMVFAILVLTPLYINTHTLTLHKNDNSLSSESVLCHSVEHCKCLIKSYEHKNQDNCRLVEVKDGDRVVFRKYYNH